MRFIPKPPDQRIIQWITKKLCWIPKFVGRVVSLCRKTLKYFRNSFSKLVQYCLKLKRFDLLSAVVLLTIWIAILLANFYFHGSYVFEGNIIAREVSFTYIGQEKKLFLNTITKIKKLNIQGTQPEPLILIGKFSSKSDPMLNQKLIGLKKLTVNLKYPTSSLLLNPISSTETNKLSIFEARIYPGSRIDRLAYNSQTFQLSFCIQASDILQQARDVSPVDCFSSDALLQKCQ